MEKETYRIQYVDNTYQLVEWTDDEFNDVAIRMDDVENTALVNRCIFKLSDIRAIVHIPAEKEDEDEQTPMVVTEMGSYERDLYDLLVQSGFAGDMGDIIGVKEVKE